MKEKKTGLTSEQWFAAKNAYKALELILFDLHRGSNTLEELINDAIRRTNELTKSFNTES